MFSPIWAWSLPLRLPHRNDAKIAKICNLWIFWPVIQPINKRPFFWILKSTWIFNFSGSEDGLLAELQAKTSRGCRFLLFQHHSYEVTLMTMVNLGIYTRCLLLPSCKKPINSQPPMAKWVCTRRAFANKEIFCQN